LHFEKLLEIIYWAEKYETTSPHHDLFFSIYIKFLKKIHPFLICKSPYYLDLWYFYLICKIIRFKVGNKKIKNSLCSRGTSEFWGPKKPFFRVGMD
jgi:hypothetical protein